MNLAKVPQEAPFISPLPFCFFSNYSCAVSSSFFFLFAFIRQLLKSWLDRLMHSITLNNVSSCLMDPIRESPNQLPPACGYTCRTVGVIVRTVETRLIFSPHFWWAVEKEKANWFRHPPNMCHQSKRNECKILTLAQVLVPLTSSHLGHLKGFKRDWKP